MPRKPTTINFDANVFDTRTALKTYILILNGGVIEGIVNRQRLKLGGILKNENHPRWGFKKGILPDHIKNINVDYRNGKVIVNYTSELDHTIEREYWEAKGYKTQQVNQSLRITTKSGRVFVTYCRSRILINAQRLNEFIKYMR